MRDEGMVVIAIMVVILEMAQYRLDLSKIEELLY
jgi:hypothetical protein